MNTKHIECELARAQRDLIEIRNENVKLIEMAARYQRELNSALSELRQLRRGVRV